MKNKIAGILVLIGGAAIIAGVVLYSMYVTRNTPVNFVSNRENLGEKLYSQITSRDLENEYPLEPADVMLLHNDIMLLLYGDIIVNDDYYKDIIRIQRKLYTEELLNSTTEEQQFDSLKESLAELKEKGVRVTKLDVGSTNYDPLNKDICVVKISEYGRRIDRIDWNYYLYKGENGRWKIGNWEVTSY